MEFFGPATKRAVQAFQSRNALAAIGRVGASTLEELRASPRFDGLTGKDLRAITPNLGIERAESLSGFLNLAMAEADISTPQRQAMFLGQVAHESGGFRYSEELASGAAYEWRRDLGNIYAGDGRRYKGRGFIQLTGRANYREAGRALGLDLINNPALAATDLNAARVAAWYWDSRELNSPADQGNFSRSNSAYQRRNKRLLGSNALLQSRSGSSSLVLLTWHTKRYASHMFDYRLVFILLTLLTVGCVEWGSSATVGALDDTTSEPSDESSPSVPSDPSTDDDPGDDATDSTEPDDVVSVAFADDQCEFFVANEERGRGDGVNWDNASPYLREAMVAGLANKNRGVCDAVVVKVGRGIYFPHPRDPDISFPLYGGLELTGGYLESDDNARDLVTAATVLAGRLGEGGPQSLHVLRGSGNGTDEVKLDGLTIQEGRATGLDDDAKGGGIFVEGLILSLTNIVIRDNYAAERGGGLWLDGGQLVEGQVLWLNNTADGEVRGNFCP